MNHLLFGSIDALSILIFKKAYSPDIDIQTGTPTIPCRVDRNGRSLYSFRGSYQVVHLLNLLDLLTLDPSFVCITPHSTRSR